MITQTEENYLKAIFKLAEKNPKAINTNAISSQIKTSAASVTDMLKRLSDKKLVQYEKYKGVQLTKQGEQVATSLIRNHRLWEVFLVDKLFYTWDEVHEMAEQLEHIRSDSLTERLDKYLGSPKTDPHGDPIPNKDGSINYQTDTFLSDLNVGMEGTIMGVKDHMPKFLKFLDSLNLNLGVVLKVMENYDYDHSMRVLLKGNKEITLSQKVCDNLFVKIRNGKK